MTEFDDCFNKGLLRKERPDREKAERLTKVAEHKLDIAKAVFDIEIYDDAIINAYAAMFQAARALLFKDGIKERSHYCVYVYINSKYKDKIAPSLLNEFNALRLARHELNYEPEITEVKEVEAESAIGAAGKFLEAVRNLLKS